MLVHARQNTHSCCSSSSSSSSTCDGSSFQHFCQAWIVRERSYMDKLLFLSSSQNHPQQEEELKSLIGEVFSHHQSYYDAKSKAAERDVFFLFCPSWFSTLERSFLWITGFRPSLGFKTLDKSIGSELTAQQVEKVQILKLETRAIEKRLSDEMIGIQESIVGPTWMQVVRRMEGQVMDGDMDQVIEMVKDRLRKLVASADLLRTKTATEIVEILNPVQAAKFLAATARLQLKVRTLGLRRDADMMANYC